MSLDEAIQEFERCWPWIEAALTRMAFKHNGKVWLSHNKEDVWERIVTGRSFFWPEKECVIITEFHTTPTGLKSHHTWLAGGNLKKIKAKMPEVEQWGKENGCHRQTGSGPEGWLRVFEGYRAIGVRKEKSLL